MTKNTFETVAMAEILLVQDLLKEAAGVIERLETRYPDDPRVQALKNRMNDRMAAGETEILQSPLTPSDADGIQLKSQHGQLTLQWELTDAGLAMAKQKVRYSGQTILRLFTAAPGARGVRTTIKDFELEHPCAEMTLKGMPQPATFAAAIGFLGRNGAFVPMSNAVANAGIAP